MPRYPNPADVPVPTVRPPGLFTRLSTRSVSADFPVHEHEVTFDRQGSGRTDVVASHFHKVVAGRVLPGPDGHTHSITQLPAGAS